MREHMWTDDAACRGMDPEIFFPARGIGQKTVRLAIEVCATCPVTAECFTHRQRINARYGVWAGRLYQPKKAGPDDE